MNPNIAKIVGLNLKVYMQSGAYDNRSATTMTRDGEPVRSWQVKFREPLFQNDFVDGVRNSIEFQNAGTTKVLINGNWTILAGGSKKFDSSNETDVSSQRFTVYFPTDPYNANNNNRLEISEIILEDKSVSQFRSKGIEA
ncbi:MAG: hypothetical protein V9E90_01460 [Saprospiraceae bacterium]